MYFSTISLLLAAASSAVAATAEDWKSRSIYQVVTDRFAHSDGSSAAPCDPGKGDYCGGTWQGIIKRLDYIQNMGFTAIWISPITYQIPEVTADLAAYHGYWQQNLYKVNSHFGTEADLKALSAALHQRGMYLMVDIVVNHFGAAGDGNNVDYSKLVPFNRPEYFHSFRLLSETSPNEISPVQAQQYWMGDKTVPLPDLKTEDPQVASMLNSWIKDLVSTYAIDGLRLDSVYNVNPEFFVDFCDAAGVFCMGEVYNGDARAACPVMRGLDGILNYPMYFEITRAFNSSDGSMDRFVDGFNVVKDACKTDLQVLGNFVENHDQPRFPSYTQDLSLIKNVITYSVIADGIPVVYYGQEQKFAAAFNPVNREALWPSNYDTTTPLYTLTAALNAIRTHAFKQSRDYGSSIMTAIYHDQHNVAFRKGPAGDQVVTVLSNAGEQSGSPTLTLPARDTGFQAGAKITEVLTCKEVTADGNGNVNVAIPQGLPGVYYPSAGLSGSSLCRASGGAGSDSPGSGSGIARPSVQSSRGARGRRALWTA